MKERNFIAQNKNKWQELEDLLKEKRKDADRLSKLFTEVSEDLSYSRTFYRNRYVSVYLNGLTQQLFYFIYKNKRVGKSRFVFFWKEELPRLIYAARMELLFSLIVFSLAFIIGVVSTKYSSEFASAILGKEYLEKTINNIKAGDPMAIYKQSNQFSMFLQISINNLYVSFLAFVTGLFFGIGSFGVLLYNGIMLGVFQYFFYKHGLFFTSAVTVWLHGTLEISSIIIASAAGITMGKGLIFPGTYERTQAFLISARRGVKILLGILPLIVLAAIIESFLTRYTETPVIIKLGLILASLCFIVSYFIVYPYRKNKSDASILFSEAILQETSEIPYDTSIVQSNGMIFSRSFLIYKKNIGRIIKYTILLAIVATGLNYFNFVNSPRLYNSIFYYINSVFNYEENIFSFVSNTLLFSICVFYSFQFVNRSPKPKIRNAINFLKIFLWSGIVNLAFLTNAFFTAVIFLITAPFLLQWLMASQLMRQNIFSALFSGGSLVGESPGKAYGFFLIAAFSGFIYFFLVDTPIVGFLTQIINWNINLEPETMKTLGKLMRLFIPFFSIFLVLPIIIIGHHLLFFSLDEIGTANGMTERVEKLRVRR